MKVLRRSNTSRFGALVAGLTLCIQLVFVSWGLVFLAPSLDLAGPFSEDALCLAGDQRKAPPADPANPGPAHMHQGLCCLAHLSPGLYPHTPTTPQPIAYLGAAPAPAGIDPFVPRNGGQSANARAPPTLA